MSFFSSPYARSLFLPQTNAHTLTPCGIEYFANFCTERVKERKKQQDFFSFASGYVLCADLMSHNHKNSGQEVLCVLALFFYVFWAIV